MSDTNQEIEVKQDEVQVTEPDAIEVEARNSGWVPKEEFHGDPHKWVDAGEFMRRAPLFEKIDLQTRELKELKRGLDALKQHHSQVRETEYKRALADLKAAKRDALIDGDPDKVIEIDDKLEAVKEAQKQFAAEQMVEAQRAAAPDNVHPEFAAWTKRNSWYETSRPMKAFADALGIELRASGMAPSEVLRQVEIKVKEEFPNKFRNPNRDKPGAVEGAQPKGNANTGKFTEASLSADEKRIMNTIVRTGAITKEQYLADLKKVKGIE